jgi:type II secretory ATPase GspE/PulE/Tfp pilus assembly ATPase PilB-like protein
MSAVNENEMIDIKSKIKEAETYRSQGLLKESLEIYNNILSSSFKIDQNTQNTITKKVNQLKKEIEDLEQDDPEISSQDISLLRQTWVAKESADDIFISASSLRELGLIKEAVKEYNKLFNLDYPASEIIHKIAECLFEINAPSKVINQTEKLIAEHNLSDQEKANVNFNIGMEMVKRKHMDLAFELFESVEKIDPDYEGLKAQMELVQSSRTYDSRYSYLLETKIVNPGQLQNALALSKKSNKSVEFILMDQNRIDKEDIGKSLSFFYKRPFVSPDTDIPVPYELLTKLKKTFLLQNSWVPLSWDMASGILDILIDDPLNLVKTDNISALMKTNNINFSVGIKEDIEQIINRFFDPSSMPETSVEEDGADSFDMMPEIDFEEDVDEEEVAEEVDESSSKVVRMVDQILISAYRKGASDIHVEPSPQTKKTSIRFRIDGVCQNFLQVPIVNARAILSRLKIMSSLDIAERRLPQDGKIKFKRKGVKTFELRLATLPTAGGFEDAVLRILAESGAMKLDDMGLTERNLEVVKNAISQPYGLFLAVGPTGSGKTTTLHSALGHINKPGVKIWTAEDPVEITQLGLRQVQCQAKIGLDFARVMRAFLRADPDIIMIGEMRDEETASIGIEASLTGHLVFSTLHTNSAPETITRLLDMGLNPLNFSDAFLAVLAQRLARRVCKKCLKKYQPSEEEINDIIMMYGKDAFESSGLEITPDLVLSRGEGCEACNGTGYRGRVAIHELMEGTKEVKIMIKREANTEDLFVQASKDGMTTLIQDGVTKSFMGLTDITEIQRVCVG